MLHYNSQQAAFQPDFAAFAQSRGGFSAFLQPYYPILKRFARGIVGSPEVAEEIAADVFIKIRKNREQLFISTLPQAYLFAATRHQSFRALPLNGVFTNDPYSIQNL
jgi:DNA-directed RNA polymerase specialized sigma24 family protein